MLQQTISATEEVLTQVLHPTFATQLSRSIQRTRQLDGRYVIVRGFAQGIAQYAYYRNTRNKVTTLLWTRNLCDAYGFRSDEIAYVQALTLPHHDIHTQPVECDMITNEVLRLYASYRVLIHRDVTPK